jgi:hypothetical protein
MVQRLASRSVGSAGVEPLNTTTPVLALNQPAIGADDDVWGTFLNDNFSILDAAVLFSDPGNRVLGSVGFTVDAELWFNCDAGEYYIANGVAGRMFLYEGGAGSFNGLVLQGTGRGSRSPTWRRF